MKILYISYFYPPLGGPAALRNLKTVKYFSEAGAEITVLTVEDIEYAYNDPSLVTGCGERHLVHVPSWDPMALLRKAFGKNRAASQMVYKRSPERLKLMIRQMAPIDDKIGWLPHLLRTGRKLLQKQDYELIYVSCGPFSSAIGAYKLAEEFHLRLVVDYRDYWTLLSDYDLMGNAFKRKLSRAWEQRILKRADFVVCATCGIRDDLAAAFDPDLIKRSFVLYNGHDERDFDGLAAGRPSSSHYSLCYFGNIYARRSLKHLYQAILELEREELVPQNLRILLYGNFNREVYDEIEHSGISERIQVMPQLSHKEALRTMQEADALILVINSSSPKGTLTSKVFEYLRLARPILAMVPQNGEAAQLLQECGITTLCPMESVSGIKECLNRLFDAPVAELQPASALAKYERGAQLRVLYQHLQDLVTTTQKV
ncbi:MAG: glycosyltransferase [Candidatus Cloacimonetes bacterium]|jgi:glycosyltransferase involved in cell wall biosynthesis|nr:glycosyltransferase [Candidatus Cloacimonadota bacterium]